MENKNAELYQSETSQSDKHDNQPEDIPLIKELQDDTNSQDDDTEKQIQKLAKSIKLDDVQMQQDQRPSGAS